jgi:hypothetical protein
VTVVGVLVEVPVMLSVVRIVRRARAWYERGNQAGREAFAAATVKRRRSGSDVAAMP